MLAVYRQVEMLRNEQSAPAERYLAPPMNQHEQAFVESFLVSNKRQRYLFLLSKPKRRMQFLSQLDHAVSHDLDRRYA